MTGRTTQPARILVVDDDVELAELLGLRLEAQGYEAVAAHSGEAALARLGRERFDGVLLDLRLGDTDGLEVLARAAELAPDLPVIVVTAHGTIETAVEAMRLGAYGFVTKPFEDHDLLQKLAHATESTRLRREVASFRRLVGDREAAPRLVGTSDAIRKVRDLVERLGSTDATVLILGESGTGKELVARALHDRSSRRERPFVAVNCAALPPDLLESTLFGHVRGAFPGATQDREGLFGAADQGTLFLDEVGEASPAVQAKLLRVLQERKFTRVGATHEESTDVRVTTATNRDLKSEVAEKRFREDLYYRLKVVPIHLPPLRERREDIPLLAELFLERSAARHGLSVPRLGADALSALLAHPFPGNVRELANAMEAVALLEPGVTVGAEALPLDRPPEHDTSEARDLAVSTALLASGLQDVARPIPSLREVRDAFERAYLELVLTRTGGNVTQAARAAGRNRTDFYDLLRRHSLSPSSFKGEGG